MALRKRDFCIILILVGLGWITGHALAAQKTSLQLLLSVDSPVAAPGYSVTYTVTVINTGPVTAERVSAEVVLPNQFVYADGATPMDLRDLGDIKPGEKIEQNILVRIPTKTQAGQYDFHTSVRAENAGLVEDGIGVIVRVGRVLGAQDTSWLKLYGLYIYGASGLFFFGGYLILTRLRARHKAE